MAVASDIVPVVGEQVAFDKNASATDGHTVAQTGIVEEAARKKRKSFSAVVVNVVMMNVNAVDETDANGR